MHRSFPTSTVCHRRRGWLAPIVGLALIVVMGAVALVLDRLWLDMARGEAEAIADIGALAACRELASDDDLRQPEPPPEGRITAAKLGCQNVVALNRIAGQNQTIDPDSNDLKIGVKVTVEDTGEVVLVETNHQPKCVQVMVARTRDRGNPVALFLSGLTNTPVGEVLGFAEASIDNHIIGLQSVGGARVPMLPLGILANDPSGNRKDTWQEQIEKRQGRDNYKIDPETRQVVAGQDGIPEILLSPMPSGGSNGQFNMAFFDVHGEVGHFPLEEQIAKGWSAADLERRQGWFVFTQGPELFSARPSITKESAAALQSIIGECRAALLYQEYGQSAGNTSSGNGWIKIQTAGLVAGRVMAVQEQDGMNFKIVFQPGVLATRAAVLPADIGLVNVAAAPNKYIHQLKLTQ